jgi:hypothetical protein
MIDVRALVQATLDTALNALGVYVFWQRRVEIAGDSNPNEYIVFTYGGENPEKHADNVPLVERAYITVKYYYRAENTDTYAKRQIIISRENLIKTSLKSAGFHIDVGPFDVGDVDDIGFYCTVFECSYSEVV